MASPILNNPNYTLMRNLLAYFLLVSTLLAQNMVSVRDNGVLYGPGTNIFSANLALLTNAIGPVDPSPPPGGTGLLSVTAGVYDTPVTLDDRLALENITASDLTSTTGNIQSSLDSINANITSLSTNVNNRLVSYGGNAKGVAPPFIYASLIGLTNYWSIGDSQTIGAMVITTNWTSGTSMLPEFRYPNRIAAAYGFNLTNSAVSGSGLPYDPATDASRRNPLAQMNRIPSTFSGVVTMMIGYNNSSAVSKPRREMSRIQAAYRSAIARTLLTNWIGADGLLSGGSSYSSFSTTGTLVDEGFTGINPFPTANPSTQNRQILQLVATNAVELTITNIQRFAIFAERGQYGGSFNVLTNGQNAANVDCTGDVSRGTRYPNVVLFDSLSGSTTITITNVSGTNNILGFGFVASPSDLNRVVVVANVAMLGNWPSRSDEWGALIGRSAASAVQSFNEYGVYFADVAGSINVPAMVPAGDPNHFNPFGQYTVYKAFDHASIPSGQGSSGNSLYSDPVIQGTTMYSFGDVTPDRLAAATSVGYSSSDYGHVTAYDWGASAYKPLRLRSTSVEIPNGAVQVLGSYANSSVPQQLPGLVFEYSTGSTASYISSYDYGTSSYLPLYLRGQSVRISGGGFQVTTASSLTTDYAQTGGTVLEYGSGWGRLSSYDYSDASYKPLHLRAQSVALTQGGLIVTAAFNGAAVTNANFPTGDSLRLEGGSTGYLTSYNQGSATYKPLVVRGSTVSLSPLNAVAVMATNGATAGGTRMYLWDVDASTLKLVYVGAADSGGTGYKVLRIAN
jgi:hypothetical protein